MPSTPPDTGQPTRGARTGREDRGERGNKWWTLVAVCMGTLMLLDVTIVNVALTGSASTRTTCAAVRGAPPLRKKVVISSGRQRQRQGDLTPRHF